MSGRSSQTATYPGVHEGSVFLSIAARMPKSAGDTQLEAVPLEAARTGGCREDKSNAFVSYPCVVALRGSDSPI
jgi:hypothetical protein